MQLRHILLELKVETTTEVSRDTAGMFLVKEAQKESLGEVFLEHLPRQKPTTEMYAWQTDTTH